MIPRRPIRHASTVHRVGVAGVQFLLACNPFKTTAWYMLNGSCFLGRSHSPPTIAAKKHFRLNRLSRRSNFVALAPTINTRTGAPFRVVLARHTRRRWCLDHRSTQPVQRINRENQFQIGFASRFTRRLLTLHLILMHRFGNWHICSPTRELMNTVSDHYTRSTSP